MKALLFVAAVAILAVASQARWSGCPQDVNAHDCATIEVPLNYSDPKGKEKANVFFRRYVQTTTNPIRAIWYFGEGNCEFSSGLPPELNWISLMARAYIITVDIRGTGKSTPSFTCDKEVDAKTGLPNIGCVKDLKNATNFQLLDIVADVAAAVPELGIKNENYLLGQGFGSLIAQRIQTVEAELFDRVLIGSPVAPEAFDIFRVPFTGEDVARRVLRDCETDPMCAARLGQGQSVESVFTQVMTALGQGTLPIMQNLTKPSGSNITNSSFKDEVGKLIAATLGPVDETTNDLYLQGSLPALLYRLRRGSDDDIKIVNGLLERHSKWYTNRVCADEAVMRTHILLSEYTPDKPASLEDILSNVAASLLPVDTSRTVRMRELYDVWPRYDRPKKFPATNPSKKATLLLPGTYNMYSGYAQSLNSVKYYSGKTDGFQPIPYTGRHTIYGLTMTGHNPHETCGAMIAYHFLSLGNYTDCVGFVPQPDWLGKVGLYWRNFWGTEDIWGYTSAPLPPIPTLPPSAVPVPTMSPTSPPHTPKPHGPGPAPSKKSKSHAGVIVGVVFGILFVIGLIFFAYKKLGGKASHERDFYGSLQR